MNVTFLMNCHFFEMGCPKLKGRTHLRNDSLLSRLLFAHHGVTLSCPRLSVGKNAHIVPYNSNDTDVSL